MKSLAGVPLVTLYKMYHSHSITPAILAVVVLYFFLRNLTRKATLPPGPRALPFVGNFHQLPRKDPFKVYQSWSKSYGSSVIYMHIFGREFVVLNSLKAITDLFEKRSSKYSTRPRLVMAGELVGRERTALLFLKYGTKWKQCRQVVHGWLKPAAMKNYGPMQENGSYRLLGQLLDNPEDFSQHVRHTSGSTLLKLTYGIECRPVQDPWIGMSEELSKITAVASQPGRWLVDSFPILAYMPTFLPGTGFLHWAKLSRKAAYDLVRKPIEKIEKEMNDGTPNSSWVLEHMVQDSRTKTEKEKDVLICSAGSLYAGGIDTVVSTLRTFFLAMTIHPEIQRRAQEEIDRVIGLDRLPNMDDRCLLPYVAAVIKEVHRINSVAPLVPHSLDEDDVYEGMRIPKGSWVMANIWAVLHDPEVYHNPDSFDPSRYESTPGRNAEPDPTGYAFGIGMGRRFCPGMHYAEAAIFINVVQVLSVFNISPPVNVLGEKNIPSFDFDVGHLRTPKIFKCNILPRSQGKIDLVRHALAE
ncbi:cytochrome P450 [Mycena floridula]|nr:cytochrome P450 [Mycena floridula]